MHDQARRFVHHQHVPILVHHGNRNRFRLRLGLRRFDAHPHLDAGSRTHHIAGLAVESADPHLSGVDPALDACARMLAAEAGTARYPGASPPIPAGF